MNLKPLMELQELQDKLRLNQEETKRIQNENNLMRLKAEYENLKQKFLACQQAAKASSLNQGSKKNEMKNILDSIKSLEKIKYSKDINTVKKLESIDKELNDLAVRKNNIEDKIIKLIEEGENIDKEALECKKKMIFIKRKYNILKESKENDLKKLEYEKSELENRINELQIVIDKETLEIYNKLRKNHNDPVAIVRHRICEGCKLEIGALDYEKVKAQNEIVRCQNCGRILMYIDAV